MHSQIEHPPHPTSLITTTTTPAHTPCHRYLMKAPFLEPFPPPRLLPLRVCFLFPSTSHRSAFSSSVTSAGDSASLFLLPDSLSSSVSLSLQTRPTFPPLFTSKDKAIMARFVPLTATQPWRPSQQINISFLSPFSLSRASFN